MKTIRSLIIPCLLGVSFLSFQCQAQVVNCSDKYETAQNLYNLGLADSALNTLKPCLEDKQALKQVSNETSANMFRLAALSSIMIGNPGDAERYVRELLKYKPDYKNNIREDDLMEFQMMLDRSTSQPSMRVGISGGINIPFLTLQKSYTDPPKSAATYTLDGSSGYQIGLVGEKTLSRSLAVEAGVGVTGVSFSYSIRSAGAGEYLYNQSITYLEIPVLARYYLVPSSSIKPYLQAGISGKFSMYVREKSDDYGSYWLTDSPDHENILATFLTGMENIGFVVGGGVAYDLKKLCIRADIRYAQHLKSGSKLGKFDDISEYDDIPSSEAFGYTNDINLITLSGLQISVGLLYNLKYKVF